MIAMVVILSLQPFFIIVSSAYALSALYRLNSSPGPHPRMNHFCVSLLLR